MAVRFLIDHDVEFAAQWFPGEIDAGKASDAEIVRRAWDYGMTVVSANGGDMVREMLAHRRSHRCTKTSCNDLNGLVVIPNEQLRAENAIKAVRKRGMIVGNGLISLQHIYDFNLYVRYRVDGMLDVKRFPACPDGEIERHAWYEALEIVGASRQMQISK